MFDIVKVQKGKRPTAAQQALAWVWLAACAFIVWVLWLVGSAIWRHLPS